MLGTPLDLPISYIVFLNLVINDVLNSYYIKIVVHSNAEFI